MSTLLISALLLSLSSRATIPSGYHNLIVETLSHPRSAVATEAVLTKTPVALLTNTSP